MARASKLKVYRTSIGFHDAYVAAPSQKAALDAWGSDKDLFARGVAEIVTDEKLTAEPLASPGKVVKRLRATADEQMAALPPDKPKAAAKLLPSDAPAKHARLPKPVPPPPPSRAALEKAGAALDEIQQRERSAIADIDRRQADLAKERRQLMAELAKEKKRLTERRITETEKYDKAIKQWGAADRAIGLAMVHPGIGEHQLVD